MSAADSKPDEDLDMFGYFPMLSKAWSLDGGSLYVLQCFGQGE